MLCKLAVQLRRMMAAITRDTPLLRSGVRSIGVKLTHTVLGFCVAVALARILGPEGYGVYAFALAIVMLLGVLARAGIPQLSVRETAAHHARGEWQLLKGLWRWCGITALSAALLVLVAGAVLLATAHASVGESKIQTLAIGLLFVPLAALTNLYGSSIRGLGYTTLGQIPGQVARPGTFLLLIISSVALAPASVSQPQFAMTLQIVSALVAFGVATSVSYRIRPSEMSCAGTGQYRSRAWARALPPLALATGVRVLNSHVGIIALGVFHADEHVGVYRAVTQMALLVTFGLQAVNQVLQPHISRCYASGEMTQLQHIVTRGARLIIVTALVPVVVFLLVGDLALSTAFGHEYQVGYLALCILVTGELANAGFGSVGLLLNMTGNERKTVSIAVPSAIMGIILHIVLVPAWGIEGAAIASAITVIVTNALMRRAVRTRLGIESMPWAPRDAEGR